MKIKPSDLYAYMMAAPGAQGEGGKLVMFCYYSDEIHVKEGNYLFGPMDNQLADEILPEFENPSEARKQGWTHFYMGGGNSLYVRDCLIEYLRKKHRIHIYLEFEELVIEAMQNILKS